MKKILKENYKFLLSLGILFIVLTVKLPYYIDAPGGITDISNKIEINGYQSKGSFNLAYVKEYKATIPTLLIAAIKKDWDILKPKDVLLDTEDDKLYILRDKILLEESISNAIYVAYNSSNSDIEIISNKLIVTYISNKSITDLRVGDEIISINNIRINNKQQISDIINKLNISDKLNIKVNNEGKEYNRYANIISDNGKKIGVLISSINEYKTNPNVVVNVDDNESGSSGGLITALSIYNSLISEDITKGLIIVGTGTIDEEGNVGSIGGVEYKLKSAVKNKANLFIVPNDENYSDAVRLKKENNYDIEILGVSNFNEVIDYLKNVN